jgi:hypothetical protein
MRESVASGCLAVIAEGFAVEASPTSQRTLRPLGVGEILDRAVTLCVRNFPLLALTWGAFAVVVAIVEYFGTTDQTRLYAALADALQHPSQGGAFDWAAIVRASQAGQVFNGWTVSYFVLLVLLTPLPYGALIAAQSSLYLGAPTSFGAAYRAGIGRFLHLLAYNIIWALCALFVYVVFVFAMVILVLVLATLGQAWHLAGTIFGAVIGTIVVLAVLALAIVASLAYEVGICTCVIDRRSFAESFTWGLARVFTRAGFWRSLLVGLASIAITIGYVVVSMTGQVILFGFVRSQALGIAYTAVVDIAGVIFVAAFMTIFYYDVRVRAEGFDLALGASDASSPAIA